MKIALLTSVLHPIAESTRKGTELFMTTFLTELRRRNEPGLDLTLYSSAHSTSGYPLCTLQTHHHEMIIPPDRADKLILFEQLLLSEALKRQDEYDLFHLHIGNGDLIVPFVPFLKKPLIITVHYSLTERYVAPLFAAIQNSPQVHFVCPSRKVAESLPHSVPFSIIPHGIDQEDINYGDETTRNGLLWAGRAVPEKGAQTALDVAHSCALPLTLCAIIKGQHARWFHDNVERHLLPGDTLLLNSSRANLMPLYQSALAFIFPVTYEEAFGLVLIESMSQGTPVIAYAKGAIPEIIEDGTTGFIVNESEINSRGNWIIKKSGKAGLIEAIEKLRSLSPDDYRTMSRNCQMRVQNHFSAARMIDSYVKLYHSSVKPAES